MGKETDDLSALPPITPAPLNGCFVAYLYFVGAIIGVAAFTAFSLWPTTPGPGEHDSIGPLAARFYFMAIFVAGAAIGLAVVFVPHMAVLVYRLFRYRS